MSASRSKRREIDELGVEGVGARSGDVRIVSQNRHAEGARAGRDVAADAAQANDPERLAGELRSDQLEPVPAPFAQRLHRLRDLAREREHQPEGLLRRRERVGGRRVEDDHAGGRRRLDVDRIDADAGARDDGQPRTGGQQIAVDARLRTNDQAVGLGQRDLQFLARAADQRVDRDSGRAQDCEAPFGK